MLILVVYGWQSVDSAIPAWRKCLHILIFLLVSLFSAYSRCLLFHVFHAPGEARAVCVEADPIGTEFPHEDVLSHDAGDIQAASNLTPRNSQLGMLQD